MEYNKNLKSLMLHFISFEFVIFRHDSKNISSRGRTQDISLKSSMTVKSISNRSRTQDIIVNALVFELSGIITGGHNQFSQPIYKKNLVWSLLLMVGLPVWLPRL